nr:GNAT family N-acetyltransferase [Mesorhizobium sp. BR1-1-16]
MAAYEPNRAIIGGVPTPLGWDYDAVLEQWEVWLAEDDNGLCGALILEPRPDELYIESIAVAPRAKGRGIGNQLIAHAESRALRSSRDQISLTVNALMTFNIDWYGRKGFAVSSIEVIGQRRRVHMAKALCGETPPPL